MSSSHPFCLLFSFDRNVLFLHHLNDSDCDELLTYIYTSSNPIFISTDASHVVTAPYNIPRRNLLQQLARGRLIGRNCWDYGVNIAGFRFPCALLSPRDFSLFVTDDSLSGNVDDLELPLLPDEYEQAVRRSLEHIVSTTK